VYPGAVTEAPALVRAEGVGRRFGRRWAVREVTIAVCPGETVALVGPNGAGKSTLLGLLAHTLTPSEGRVEGGEDAGFVPQRPSLYTRLTARENLRLFAKLDRVEARESAVEAVLDRAGVGAAIADRPTGELSVGQRQRVNVAIGLLGDPRVILLDEPTASLDPRQRALLWRLLRGVTDRQGAVIFTTQNVEEVQRHADRLVVLHEGRPVHAGTVDEFTALAGSGEDDFEAAFVRFLERVANGTAAPTP
jgi:ABC-2 type transport system ATP-binding protein